MGYGMIADVGNLLVEILCRELVPGLIPHKNQIGLCSPDGHGDLKVGIFLYNISENPDIRISGMVNAGVSRQVYPSTYLDLYYMITAYSDTDMKYRAEEEHRILGRIVQALGDNRILSEGMLGGNVSMPAKIQFQKMESYEKNRMWNFQELSYKLSLFYVVRPVEIPSARSKEIVRVRDVEYQVQE